MRVGRVGVGGAGAGAGAASARALLAGTRSQRVLPVAREAAGDADEGAQEAAVAGAGAQPAASLGAGRPSALRRAVRSSDPGTGSVVGREGDWVQGRRQCVSARPFCGLAGAVLLYLLLGTGVVRLLDTHAQGVPLHWAMREG